MGTIPRDFQVTKCPKCRGRLCRGRPYTIYAGLWFCWDCYYKVEL